MSSALYSESTPKQLGKYFDYNSISKTLSVIGAVRELPPRENLGLKVKPIILEVEALKERWSTENYLRRPEN